MKANQEILDEFGKKIALECFDPSYIKARKLKNLDSPPKIYERYSTFFKELKDSDFDVLESYLKEQFDGIIHNVLRIFEENEQFKLIYEEDGKQVDLNKISEMLKAEPIIEGGWIERFSKELKKNT